MTERGKPQDLESLLETLLGDGAAPVDPLLVAELAARLRADEPVAAVEPGDWIALLSAYLDGGLDEDAKRKLEALLATSPAALQDLIAARAHLDDAAAHHASAPPDLVDAAAAAWTGGRADAPRPADVVPFRPAGRPARAQVPLVDSFQLMAAASGADHQAILCRSQSGLWTLEIFVGTSAEDEREGRGYLLLTVHPDHRASYEGRTARVFVTVGGDERVLAEAAIRDGEIYTPVALRGLDLWTRDAVNVVFSPGAPAS